jgi:hypothetical protein
MSEAMNMTQLGEVIKHARQHNCPFDAARGLPIIKYIDPHIDNRDGKCFSITFRGFGTEQQFYTVNEQRENPKSLYDRCLTYLETGQVT